MSQKFAENKVQFAAVFGSHAKGDAKPESDLDILIKYQPESHQSFFDFVGLAQDLEDITKKKVDLVTINGLNRHIKDEVLSSMQVIYGQR